MRKEGRKPGKSHVLRGKLRAFIVLPNLFIIPSHSFNAFAIHEISMFSSSAMFWGNRKLIKHNHLEKLFSSSLAFKKSGSEKKVEISGKN
jgi:hypothetical protein